MTTSQIDTFGLRVLCIDDSRSQLLLYRSQLEGMYTLACAETYTEAIACLTASRPDLIVLDMTMPQVTGLEFLDILRFTPSYDRIPVIIVSGDDNPDDIKEAFRRGAADYVRKPYDEEELLLRINRIFQLITATKGTAASEVPDMPAIGRRDSARDLLVRSLADIASARDNEHTGHLDRIGLYAEELSRAAAKTTRYRIEMSEEFIVNIRDMAKLHDIGKVNVPDHILRKPEALTDREFDFIRRHTTDGARTIDQIRLSFPDYAFLGFARDLVLHHHERWDGSGYPDALIGEGIPLSARVTAIADVFDALTTKRIYRNAVGFDEACTVIAAGHGTAFDPDLTDIFKFCHARFREIAEKHRD